MTNESMTEPPNGDDHRPARGSRRALAVWVGVALVLILVFVSIGSWVGRALTSIGDALPDVAGALIEGRPERASDDAHWAGAGRYAVVQSFDTDGQPYVVVWDRITGKLREQRDVALASVEPHAPVVWLRMAGEGSVSPPPGQDSMPERLFAWVLDETGAEPSDRVDSRWRPWLGPGGYTAHLEIDVLKGAYPSRLILSTAELSGEGVRAEIPEDVVTFMPLGWSQSGRFFAVEELIHDDAQSLDGKQVFIVSAEDGSVSAQARLPRDAAGRVIWDNRRDALLWTAPRSTGDPASPPRWTVMELTPSGEERTVGLRVPERWTRAWSVRFVGASVSGPVMVADTDDISEIWQLAVEGPVHRGSVPFGATEWSDGSGLLVVNYRWHEPSGGSVLEVAAYDVSGGDRRTVYEAPQPSSDSQETQ